jgi:hypothetical protein
VGLELKIKKRVYAGIDGEQHAATVAAVAAVRAAEGLELLPVDGDAPMPTVAGLHMQDGPVHEARHVVILTFVILINVILSARRTAH